ncbi:Neelaredoxin [candidate division WOR-3 bacterium]|uniref:Neelaredoxin n=1 Tax=candidate division WOR-3 bacterium TaxID=2052148 RepID=A0A9D5K9F9_UNCW3|nr:Neelaredoxin [candidate division WOR-3 bacterium]MBD3364923.1 Neelaredoxin [candidate division WOR-3 bacterium]
MSEHITDNIQSADWKAEKHVPVIDCPDKVKRDEWVKVTVTLGKEITHPNTTEHHIRWIKAFFVPDGAKFAYDLGTFEFNAHGESAEGPNTGPVYTHHEASFSFKTAKPGTINVLSYCNIHGLWESSKRVDLI